MDQAFRVREWMRWWSAWWPSIAIMAAIFWVSSHPGGDLPDLFPHQDKVAHFLVYALLCAANYRATCHSGHPSPATAFLAAVAYGATDEFHQRFVPGRTADVMDLLTDAMGAAAVWVWVCASLPKRKGGNGTVTEAE